MNFNCMLGVGLLWA